MSVNIFVSKIWHKQMFKSIFVMKIVWIFEKFSFHTLTHSQTIVQIDSSFLFTWIYVWIYSY